MRTSESDDISLIGEDISHEFPCSRPLIFVIMLIDWIRCSVVYAFSNIKYLYLILNPFAVKLKTQKLIDSLKMMDICLLYDYILNIEFNSKGIQYQI